MTAAASRARACLARLAVLAWLSVFALVSGQAAWGKEAAPLAADEAVEQRLVDIASELRCLVCQNESLAGSRADLANDLRREIRTQIKDGKSDAEIMDFMVSRYGDFVRYRPPLKGYTLLLWFGPLLLLVVGLAVLIRFLRRRDALIKDAPLSAQEHAAVERLLDGKEPER